MKLKNIPDCELINKKTDSFNNKTLMFWDGEKDTWKDMITSQTNEAIYNKEISNACATLYM